MSKKSKLPKKGSSTTKPHRLLLVGPSVELARARRGSWVREQLRSLKPKALIGVDGGIAFLGRHHPEVVIGDWDSGRAALAREFARGGARMVTLPCRKDFSDLHYALELAAGLESPATELILLGFTGGRPDHHLASLAEIARFAAAHATSRRFQKIAAIGPEAEYHFLAHQQPPLGLTCAPGTLVSVFAFQGTARGVTMKGFEYCLNGCDLEFSSRGLSNLVRSRGARIRVRKGTLLVVVPHGR